jgi:starch phosphorylase
MIETFEQPAKTLTQKPELPFPLQALERLSWNYWWSWSRDGASVFRDLDAEAWEECEHNPRQLLEKVSEYRLAQMATDPTYLEILNTLRGNFERYMSVPVRTIGTGVAAITAEHPVAYFCAEYGIHNSLPLYSGGLGVLAGDHLKSASDLGVPLVAVGLLYHYGYFRQRLNREGWQEERYGDTDPTKLPVFQVFNEDGSPLYVDVLIRERNVRAQIWRVDVGRVPLYLLDTNIEQNAETDRWVTGHLYGGDRETRIVQEMVLGIGGARLLRNLKIQPSVYHLNEGHSAFLTLELARELIQSEGLNFTQATERVRQRCVFTTHTPVAAGNDEFAIELLTRSFGPTYAQELGISPEEFISLGRTDPKNTQEPYGLTPLALRMCRSSNGVSRKHGEVSRALWHELWPDRKVEEVPISHVTNGVHAPTWTAPLLQALFEKYIGKNWKDVLHDPTQWEQGVARISDEELWAAHSLLKNRLISFIRLRAFQSRLNREEEQEYTAAAQTMFDPRALTIGFARRVAGYKRWSLLLKDQARLLSIINNEDRPVQFVFAGKAHPQDSEAKIVLQQVALWKYDAKVRHRAVFLEDYDHEIARQLVQSIDVWMNVPRRPLEASGTSGEKVAVNGGLNFSILDGWWLEGYDGTNGFAIGDTAEGTKDAETDAADVESLYRVLEQEIVPRYYDRDANGLPRRWIAMMKRSIATLAPQFNSDRMVDEYVRKIYLGG